MKKLFLAVSATALLAASPALAEDNKSDIQQIASINAHVFVDQKALSGNLNESFVKQDNVTNGGADVIQINHGQTNHSVVTQGGTYVAAIVEQDSATGNNSSEIDQTGTGGGDPVNLVEVYQYGSNVGNTSYVDQDGAGSWTELLQEGEANTNNSTITQAANYSLVALYQGGVANENKSNVHQAGNVNGILIGQGGTANTNHSLITQDGNNSGIGLAQGGSGAGNANVSEIVQDANDSCIGLSQSETSTCLHHASYISQSGNGNSVVLYQD